MPAGVVKTMELYMNRDNGALLGFYNTSYMTPLTNWTNYTTIELDEDDDEGDLEDGDTLIVDSTQSNTNFLDDALVFFKETKNQNYGPWGKDGLFGFLGKSKPKGWYYLHYYE